MGNELTERELRLLRMRFIEGKSLAECAKALDIGSWGRVRLIESKAVRKLLQATGHEPTPARK